MLMSETCHCVCDTLVMINLMFFQLFIVYMLFGSCALQLRICICMHIACRRSYVRLQQLGKGHFTKPVFSVVIQNDFDTSEITVKTDFVHSHRQEMEFKYSTVRNQQLVKRWDLIHCWTKYKMETQLRRMTNSGLPSNIATGQHKFRPVGDLRTQWSWFSATGQLIFCCLLYAIVNNFARKR